MKYSSATIDACVDGFNVHTVDLDGLQSVEDLYMEIYKRTTSEEDIPDEADEPPHGCVFTNPQGFAVHLFSGSHPSEPGGGADCSPVPNFDELLEAWSDESDDDRREAMGEYLDDMGADDLSDFDEAYQGQYDSGAAFSEELCDQIGALPKDFPDWVCIDWGATWNCNLRHDYHITDSGHVFRHL